jgi:prophage tail gpP-like protein
MPDHNVTLTIGSTAYEGWETIDVMRGLDSVCGAFELKCSDRSDSSERSIIRAGTKCSVQLDGDTVITGFIDDVAIDHSTEQHTLSVRGRDAACDLVDCSAIFKTGTWSDSSMLSICKNLCEPFGMSVSSEVDVSKPLSIWNIEPGETVWENIERMARAYGVLVLSNGLGGITITRPRGATISTSLVLGKNILSARAMVSHARRFSKYIITSQRYRDDVNSGTAITEQEGVAIDSGIKRYRPMIELFEDSYADTDALNKRAKWRMSVNASRAQQATIFVQGWSHSDGLWKPNTLVRVDHAPLGLVKSELLIAGVHHSLNQNGSRTELSLAPRNAYQPDEQPGDLFL